MKKKSNDTKSFRGEKTPVKNELLNHAQWYAVRTTTFKKWFGDWESAAEIAQIENNLQNFISTLNGAAKESREDPK